MNEKLIDFTDEELIAEVIERGHSVDYEADISDFSDEAILDAVECRDLTVRGGFASCFGTASCAEWLRSANPPQEIRDAYWQEFGRIL